MLALAPGKIKNLPDFAQIAEENNVQIEHHLHIGDLITPYRTNLDGCGYVVASNLDVNLSIEQAAEVRSLIDKSIERV